MTRIIIKRKSQSSSPIPSSPTTSASSTSSPKSASKSPRVKLRLYRSSNKCPVCKATIVDRNNALKRHIERHAKLAEIQAMNIPLEPDRNGMSDAEMAHVRDMWQSVPAKLRATGGVFKHGPLAGKGEFSGMPEVFMTNGRLKKKYLWIRKDIEGRVGRRPLKDLKDGNSGGLSAVKED
ncbi:hypothetical protein ACLX1H_000089 [Fusarium chlamydosporum]